MMNSELVQVQKQVKQQHFVLVHGSCHGAWCWYKLETLLRSAGHQVTSLDMAACGINPKQNDELRSISDYFDPLIRFMESIPIEEKVILVGHSHGGFGISMTMENFPEKISVAVFVTASMPGTTFSYSTIHQQFDKCGEGLQMDNQFGFDDGPESPPTSLLFGPNYLSSNVYQNCSPEDLLLATKLLRPIRLFSEENMSKELTVSETKYGSVNRVFVVSGEDKVMTKEFQQWMIENNPTDIVKEITGSDHMVMLSKPQQLCACLQEIAEYFSRFSY
ncbi:hypothetical protein AQUCO_01000319v1 [Aquilegia coerulea]|uniref:AB hydrolase-1 domain-containing protein n=1 Tax=Aquilegia coerulea TaxID=218851 RepID=A0A2G5E9D1_AQUCA|nr:hypothetical protein AQUCO_01000319v1 [Aquilegia coerulea]